MKIRSFFAYEWFKNIGNCNSMPAGQWNISETKSRASHQYDRKKYKPFQLITYHCECEYGRSLIYSKSIPNSLLLEPRRISLTKLNTGNIDSLETRHKPRCFRATLSKQVILTAIKGL